MEKEHGHDLYLNKAIFVTSRQDNILNHYEVIPKELGRGAYGVVYKGKQTKAANQMRAIKKMSRKLLKNPEILINEVEVLKSLDHPNIIRLYEVFEDASNVYLVQEYYLSHLVSAQEASSLTESTRWGTSQKAWPRIFFVRLSTR